MAMLLLRAQLLLLSCSTITYSRSVLPRGSAADAFVSPRGRALRGDDGSFTKKRLPALKSDDSTGYVSTTSPFYRDPLFDGAHDAELVWHEAEQCWWLTYLQNRYNSCAKAAGTGTGSTTGTDLGLASTPDLGRTWVYRGVMAGLDVPAADRRQPFPPGATTAQYGGATWWRPAVTTVRGVYHGFFSYWEQTRDWGLWKVVHYTSSDMQNWEFQQFVRNSTCAALGCSRLVPAHTHAQPAGGGGTARVSFVSN